MYMYIKKKKKKKLVEKNRSKSSFRYNGGKTYIYTSIFWDQFQHLMVSGKGPRKLGKKRLSH